MRLPRFEYFEPKSVEEACSLLAGKAGVKVIAGGTDLLVSMKQRAVSPAILVNIKGIPSLDYISHDEREGLKIGASTTLHALEASPVVKERFSALAQAAGKVASPHVRRMGTVGGNICLDTRCPYYNQSHFWRRSQPACFKKDGDVCHVVKGGDHCYALFSADMVPALIALDAKIKLNGSSGDRVIELEDFYTGDGKTVNTLRSDELLTEIQVPNPAPHTGGVYLRHSFRDTAEFPVVGVSVLLSSRNGVCDDARVVLVSVASDPIRAAGAERVFEGKKLNADLVEEGAQSASKEIPIVSLPGVPAGYKRGVIKALVKRAAAQAWQLARAGD